MCTKHVKAVKQLQHKIRYREINSDQTLFDLSW